jgi:hypothetical protein
VSTTDWGYVLAIVVLIAAWGSGDGEVALTRMSRVKALSRGGRQAGAALQLTGHPGAG